MVPKKLPKSWKISNFEYLLDFNSTLFSTSTRLMTKFGNLELFTDTYPNLFVLDKMGNIYIIDNFDEINEDLNEVDKFIRENWKYRVFKGFFDSKTLFFNADEDEDYRNLTDWSGIGISFNCLCELDPKALDKIQSGKLVVKSFSKGSESIALTSTELKKFKKRQQLTPPQRGFSVIKKNGDYYWHKSEYVLMYDIGLKKSYLLGQDEDQYFGVELPSNPKNVDEAIECLKPKEIRNIHCDRQGEWFFVPVDVKNVPSKDDEITVVIEAQDPSACVILPRTIDGNPHILSAGEIRIKDNIIYAFDPTLEHDQHETMMSTGWIKFVKNTAVRSVSVDGVD